MRLNWRTELPHLLLLAGMFLVAAVTWSNSPDRIPVHWGIDGRVNGYGGRFEGILLTPLIATGIYLMMLFLPRLDPNRANYAQFAGAYSIIRMVILVAMAAIYLAIILSIRGYEVNMAALMPVGIGLLFLVLGGVMGKIRPNWFVGIRTPWTLASKLAWTKTHRVGGWIFVGEGIVMIATGLLLAPWAFWAMLAVIGAGTISMVVYSYLVWRSDPDRIPISSVRPVQEA